MIGFGKVSELVHESQKGVTHSHDPKDPVGTSCQRISGSSILGGEDLGGVCIQNGIHDVGKEVIGTVPPEKLITGFRSSRGIQENACQNR